MRISVSDVCATLYSALCDRAMAVLWLLKKKSPNLLIRVASTRRDALGHLCRDSWAVYSQDADYALFVAHKIDFWSACTLFVLYNVTTILIFTINYAWYGG
jgi:hypothetical protein